MAGDTGAPRPTLVAAGCERSAVEQDSVPITSSAPSTARALLNSLIFDFMIMARHYSALASALGRNRNARHNCSFYRTNDSHLDRSRHVRVDGGFANSTGSTEYAEAGNGATTTAALQRTLASSTVHR